jgi:hypothetical protein
MEKEISSGAMLGIVLIALAAIIGIGFGIFAIAKSTANDGITNVQDSLATVSDSTFDDYNQKTVTGSTVKTAITNLSGKSYAILINTQAMNAKQATTTDHSNVCVFDGQEAYNGSKTKAWVNFNALLSEDGTKDKLIGTTVKSGKKMDAATVSTIDSDTKLAASSFTLDSGVYKSSYTFYTDNGNVQYDTKTGSINTSGDCLQITDNTKFKANLIKDDAGVIRGVVFEQISKQ